MMKGTNEIVFCAAQMQEAVETFLNEHVLRAPVRVTKIVESGDGFMMFVEDAEEAADLTAVDNPLIDPRDPEIFDTREPLA